MVSCQSSYTSRDQPAVQQIITYQIGETETLPADQHWSLPPIVKISQTRLLLDLKESEISTFTAGQNQLTALIAGKSSILVASTSLVKLEAYQWFTCLWTWPLVGETDHQYSHLEGILPCLHWTAQLACWAPSFQHCFSSHLPNIKINYPVP